MSATIRELTGVPEPKVYTNSKAIPLHAADPQLLYGLELEIENVPNWDELVVAGMSSVEDGSLRNDGREFLTAPSTYSVVCNTLERFFERAKLTDNNYSERCSIHVHANCQDLTTDQLSGLCMLYQVYERLLYMFVGEERDKNIFCIPWDQTTLTYNIINSIETKRLAQLKNWQKYTGLNLLPLLTLGTVEFRHMPGTYNINKIRTWLNLIGSLFAYVRNNDLNGIKKQLVELNSTSQYEDLTSRVFTSWSKELSNLPNYQMTLEEGVLNMKYAMLKPPELSSFKTFAIPPEPDFVIDDVLRQEQEVRARLQQRANVINTRQPIAELRHGEARDADFILGMGGNLRNINLTLQDDEAGALPGNGGRIETGVLADLAAVRDRAQPAGLRPARPRNNNRNGF